LALTFSSTFNGAFALAKLLANYNFGQLAPNYVTLEKLLLDFSQSGSIKLLIRHEARNRTQ